MLVKGIYTKLLKLSLKMAFFSLASMWAFPSDTLFFSSVAKDL